MEFFTIDGRRYARFERLSREVGLLHAFSTRPQDVSARTDAHAPRREAARRQMARDLGFDPERLHYCVQVHETRIAFVEAAGRSMAAVGDPLGGRSPSDGRRLEGYDAATTAAPGVALMTFSADCPLVLVYDPVRRAVGMVHASWRCTVAAATLGLVRTMCERFGCRPAELLAGVGPSAGPQAYEVREDVYAAAAALPERERLFPRRDGRMYFDLWEANRTQLVRAGLREESIEVAGLCTMTGGDVFYSFRREGAGCGHFGLMAGVI